MTVDLDRARGALAALVGEAHVDLAPDGPGGPERLRASPADEDELRATLATGAEHGLRVIPCGFGSKLGWTALTRDPALLVSTRRISGVVSYEPADGTLAARAGTTMAELRATVLAGGHALTPDVPAAERATLGGVVAAGQSGLDRERYGPVRHHVLGARVMLADGTVARSGGQLVKNVTGFDLQRLYTGSHGTLCVLLEVALRLFPAPEHEALVMAGAPDAETVVRLAAAVRGTQARPLALFAAASHPLDQRSPFSLFVALGGKAEALAREVQLVREVLGPCAVLEGDAARAEREALRERDFAAAREPWIRLTTAPGDLRATLAGVQRVLAEERRDARLWIQPGAAILDVQLVAAAAADRATALAARLRADPDLRRANVHVRNAQASQRTRDRVWGSEPAGLTLMRALRERLDPAHAFARERAAGGL
jgi:glycolate oxidase FAD binding subunit